jgi:hypothetical protein
MIEMIQALIDKHEAYAGEIAQQSSMWISMLRSNVHPKRPLR